MKKRYLLLLFSLFVLFSCELIPPALSDTRFNGDFVYSYYWKDADGIEERNEYTSYDFDGTSKVLFYTKYSSYSYSSGWSYSGDYIGDYYMWDYEFEISNGMYRTRLWDNSYSDWGDWKVYSFSEDGNILTLDGKQFVKQ